MEQYNFNCNCKAVGGMKQYFDRGKEGEYSTVKAITILVYTNCKVTVQDLNCAQSSLAYPIQKLFSSLITRAKTKPKLYFAVILSKSL